MILDSKLTMLLPSTQIGRRAWCDGAGRENGDNIGAVSALTPLSTFHGSTTQLHNRPK